MADIHKKNRDLFIKKYERDKLVAQANIQSREIRILELLDEIERNKDDIEAQNKVIRDMDFNINQQKEEIAKGN